MEDKAVANPISHQGSTMSKNWIVDFVENTHAGNVTHAAAALGISRQRLMYLMDSQKRLQETLESAEHVRKVKKWSKATMYDKLRERDKDK